MTVAFKKAVKYAAKGRVAIIGPAGSGKSFTALRVARTLVGPTGKIAALDTEHGSLSKYADKFDFDVLEMDSYSPRNFLDALEAAEGAGYDAFLTDSLSHFWMGKDGALEFVDTAAKRSQSRDGMSGWKEFRPHERQMVDAMIASRMHVICTMRTKTAYEDQVNEKGKKVRVKIGLAPVQREGLEYEFDLVGLMDDDNNFIVDKSRCSDLTGKVLSKPGEREFAVFRDWLAGDARPQPPAPPAAQPQHATQSQTRSQNGHAPTNGNGTHLFKVDKQVVNCFALNVEARTSRNGNKPYRVLKMNGKIGDQVLAFCWHASLFNALDTAKEKQIQFEYEIGRDGKSINILNVLDVGGQEYRDGKPYPPPGNPDADPLDFDEPEPPEPAPVGQPVSADAGLFNGTEITDDDIPF